MAKHIVKCYYCGKQFDTNEKEYIKVNSRRYAHKKCSEEKEQTLSQEQKDKIELEEYILKLFKVDFIPPRIQLQIKKYIEENKYTYSGMRKALIYFFEIKGNSIDKANNSIGIVPYIYDKAKKYYFELWQAQQKNKDIQAIDYKPKVVEVTIPVPQPRIKKSKTFSFLDEEVNNEQ